MTRDGNIRLVYTIMRRLNIILLAILLFGASNSWALQNCQRFGSPAGHRHDGETASAAHHQGGHAHDHHSDGDRPTVHCPNLFSEFVLSSVFLPNDQRVRLGKFFIAPSLAQTELAQSKRYNSFESPPGSVSALVPDYLLLSVLRI